MVDTKLRVNMTAKVYGAPAPVDGWYIKNGATITTSDGNITTLDSLTLLDEKLYHIVVSVLARKRDGSHQNLYHLEGLFYRTAAGDAIQEGHTTHITLIESDENCDCVFDCSGNDMRVRITGIAAETWDWKCVLKYQIHGSLA